MIIYMIRHKKTGKIYVGKTVRSFEERIREHFKKGSPCYIDRALQKYGIEEFEISIIAECDTLEELNELEKFYIAKFDCKHPNGYNLTDGGEGIPGYKAPPELSKRLSEMRKGRPNTPEQRAKISAKLKGREFSDEHKANISAAKLGHPTSDETKEKLRVANLGKKYSLEVRQKKSASCKTKRAVRCIETGEIFESIKAAARWVGLTPATISIACKNPNRTAGGYHWEFVENLNEK